MAVSKRTRININNWLISRVAAVNQTKVEYLIITFLYGGCPQNESKTNLYTRDCLLIRKPLLLLSFLDTYLQAIRYCLFFLEMFTKDTLLQAIRFSIL